MKKIIFAMLITSGVSGSAFASCTYNFDATQAQIQSMGTDGATFPSVIGTKLTYQTAQQNKVYAAYSQNYLARMLAANNPTAMEFTKGDKAIQTSGIMAFELKIKVPDTNGSLNIFPIHASGIMQNGKALNILIGYQKNSSSNGFLVTVTSNDNSVTSSLLQLTPEATSDSYQKIGIYMNQNSNQVGLIFNGVNKGYFAAYPSKLDNLYYGVISNFYGLTAADSAKDVSIELLLDHTQLNFSYPTGTKDICGVAL
ncbi:DUF4882 domain-containing protein [Acinetobacter gyllenbergii]|uniref:DUF4882 domain-containing protein n=1 Tax=Acinetobacter gyllenbergii TaxID=134534 RepID=UPI0021D2D694|nr:DUF4882 domain-containing protein [Acinetobacter gyllenbergii]MCU4582236.1 DUF4882 domain-containing protein [Acinetobacter gyllenbergii]